MVEGAADTTKLTYVFESLNMYLQFNCSNENSTSTQWPKKGLTISYFNVQASFLVM